MSEQQFFEVQTRRLYEDGRVGRWGKSRLWTKKPPKYSGGIRYQRGKEPEQLKSTEYRYRVLVRTSRFWEYQGDEG